MNQVFTYCQKPLTHTGGKAPNAVGGGENKVYTQMGNQGTASTGMREGVGRWGRRHWRS